MTCDKCGKVTKHKRTTPTKLCVRCFDASITFMCEQPKNYYFVYMLYDKAGSLKYVGMTVNPRWRFMDHIMTHRYWTMKVVKGFERKQDAAQYEFYLTVLHLPEFNTIAIYKHKKYYLSELKTNEKKRLELLKKCGTCGTFNPVFCSKRVFIGFTTWGAHAWHNVEKRP